MSREGSDSEVDLANADCRLIPESGLNSDIAPCPKSAKSGISSLVIVDKATANAGFDFRRQAMKWPIEPAACFSRRLRAARLTQLTCGMHWGCEGRYQSAQEIAARWRP
jgi:hypothetical protein